MRNDLDIAKRLVRTEQSALKRGIEFNLSFKRLKAILSSKTCYITGETLSLDPESNNYLTLERLDPQKGYTDDNVVPCAKYMNLKKGDLTPEEINQMYKALKKKKLL